MENQQETLDQNQTPMDSPTEKTVNEPPKPEPVKVLAKISAKGQFTFRNHEELATAASMMIQTSMAPQHLKSEGKTAVMAALVLCRQYSLPQKAMNQMSFIKGRLTCYGSLVTALAERHPMYGEKREFFITEDCEEICVKNKNLKAIPWAAVVQITKKGHHDENEYFFSMDDAKLAGLDKPKKRDGTVIKDSPWIKYVKDMLKHKARKRALESEYASALEGIEYHEDIKEVIDVTPLGESGSDIASQINEVMKT